MTIRELHDITGETTTIYIIWNGQIRELDRRDVLDISAYGKYLIDEIQAINHQELAARIKAIPATN